ncbi:MAG TPA: hypothetical protein VGK73_22465 [Polyangiaceae bacterium]
MWRHTTGIVTLFVLLVIGFEVALIAGSTALGVIILVTGLVLAFVMGIAWMRPTSGQDEHHPPVDKMVNDQHT